MNHYRFSLISKRIHSYEAIDMEKIRPQTLR